MQNRTRVYINRYVMYILLITVVVHILKYYANKIYHPEGYFNPNQLLLAKIFSYAWLLGNLVLAIIIYGDMKRLNRLNWWIIGITLINMEFGAIVCLIHYFANNMKFPTNKKEPKSTDNKLLDNFDSEQLQNNN